MSTIEVKVPDIGDFKDVPVIEILVKPGDTVKPEDPLVTLESDKAAMDVPSPQGGVVKELKTKVGDKVSEGNVLLMLDAATERATQSAAPARVPEEPSTPSKPAPAAPATSGKSHFPDESVAQERLLRSRPAQATDAPPTSQSQSLRLQCEGDRIRPTGRPE